MREHPELYASDFSRMFEIGTYSQFLDAKSHPQAFIGDLIIQGACDAFSVTITRLFSFGTNVMTELHPKNMVYHRELFMSCLPNHLDSMFNVGEIPPPLFLSDKRIEELRNTGEVRHEDVAGCISVWLKVQTDGFASTSADYDMVKYKQTKRSFLWVRSSKSHIRSI